MGKEIEEESPGCWQRIKAFWDDWSNLCILFLCFLVHTPLEATPSVFGNSFIFGFVGFGGML